jgi:photosystem II stability/assembly factor-like uncharacterized protein
MIDTMIGWATTKLYPYVGGGYTFRTTDGGIHWKDVSPISSVSHERVEGYVAYFLTAASAWIVTAYGDIFRTTDAGQTWQETASVHAPNGNQVGQIIFINLQDGWMLFGGSDTSGQGEVIDIFRTNDGGIHWEKVSSTGTTASPNTTPGHLPLGASAWNLSFLNASTGWATYEYPDPGVSHPIQFYTTHDGGATWSQQTLPQPSSLTPFMTSAPTFFTSQDGILPVILFNSDRKEGFDFYITHDGGAHWSSTSYLRIDIDLSHIDAMTAFMDINHGLVVDASRQTVYRTSDGGQHWTTIPLHTTITRIFYLSFVSTQNGMALGFPNDSDRAPSLFKTADGGQTWTKINFSVV